MRFKLDENLPLELVQDLEELGHDVDSVRDEGLVGFADSNILAAAKRDMRVFLTMDKGIADVRRYPPSQYAGIVLLRPGRSGREALLELIRPNLLRILNFDLDGHLLIVNDSGLRYR